MHIKEVERLFIKHADEYLNFKHVVKPRSKSRNLHGIMLLDSLIPFGEGNFLSGAEHDEVYLDVDVEALSEKLSEDLIVELIRSGITLDTSFNCLRMNV